MYNCPVWDHVTMQGQGTSIRTYWGSRTHCARTVHLFFHKSPDPIVLLVCYPLTCCVAELLPHFTLNAMRAALYM